MKNRLGVIACSALLSASPFVQAADDFGLPGELFNFGVGARPLAMGRAYTGVADDIDSLYWNPAGLATFRSSQVTFQYSPLRLGGAHQYLAYAQPIYNMGNIGVGIINQTSGDVERRDANNILAGNFDSRETGYFLSYAQKLKEKIALGANLKMAELTVDGSKQRGFGADVGALYLFKKYTVGTLLRNLIPPVYKFSSDREVFPTILRFGGSARFFENHLLTALDFDKTLGTPQGFKWHLGLEGKLIDMLALRVGIDSTEITTGLGFKWRNYQVDYAAGFQDLGIANRTSIKVFFGGYEIYVKATRRVFSPVGIKNTTTFKIRVANRQRIVSWILAIRNSEGYVVRSYTGYQAPPKRLPWDGKDAQGKIVPAGGYTYRMSATDTKNRTEVTPSRSLRILAPTPFEIEAR